MSGRTSIRSRVVQLAVGVAVIAVILTAWLTTRAAERSINDSARRSLEVDAAIYQSLVDYGSTHQSWSDVEPLLTELSDRYDRRIALTDERGRLVADSDRSYGGTPRPLPKGATAQLDPASPTLGQFGVDATAVPTDDPRPEIVASAVSCLDAAGISYDMVDFGDQAIPQPSQDVTEQDYEVFVTCTEPIFGLGVEDLAATEQFTADFNAAMRSCLTESGVAFIDDPELGPSPVDESQQAFVGFDECYEEAFSAIVAPPVLLYLGTAANVGPFGGASTWPTLAIAGTILLVAGGAAWLLARRLTRPLVELTDAAGRLGGGDFDHRVPSGGTGEIGVLAHAFNTMAESLQTNERVRRQMVSDIAHELRNPLVTLNGTLEAIEDGVYEPNPDVINSMAEETAHLSRLVRDLQDLANADAGGLSIRLDDGDLADVATAVVDAYQPVAMTKQIELTAQVEPVPARFDAARIRQVLDNLVSNALRHTAAGGAVTVTVNAAELSVRDTGEGIAADDVPHVFDRFWRADPSRTRATGGSGLGLAIAKELVDAHDAELSVQSEAGKGTTFTIVGLATSNTEFEHFS
jgi:two-component system, OmpR family, sensor histidine kinase BaeS